MVLRKAIEMDQNDEMAMKALKNIKISAEMKLDASNLFKTGKIEESI